MNKKAKKSSLKSILGVGIGILSFAILLNSEDLYYSYFPKYNKFQKSYNVKRRDLGVLPIPMEWLTKDNKNRIKIWKPVNELQLSANAIHFMKIVEVQDDRIILDRDKIGYFGNRDSFFEFVVEIEFNFKTKSFSNYLTTYFNDGTVLNRKLNTFQRDSLLNIWNFHYIDSLKK